MHGDYSTSWRNTDLVLVDVFRRRKLCFDLLFLARKLLSESTDFPAKRRSCPCSLSLLVGLE
jgi:hypothetical protein